MLGLLLHLHTPDQGLLHLHTPDQVRACHSSRRVLATPGLGVGPLWPGRTGGGAYDSLLPAPRLSVAPGNWDPRGTLACSHL